MGRKKIHSGDEKERRRQAADRYRNSEKGKITIEHYRNSKGGKEAHNRTCHKYRKTEKGKLTNRKACYQLRYGITVDDYNQLFQEQQGRCKTCNKHQSELKDRLNIDHDHQTGKIRGLLCRSCNHALGLIEENIIILENMKQYLKG